VEADLDQQLTVSVMQVGMAESMEKPMDLAPKILSAYYWKLPSCVEDILFCAAMDLYDIRDALELLPNFHVMVQLERFRSHPLMPAHAHAEDGNEHCLECVEDGSVEECEVYFSENLLFRDVEASVVRMQEPNKELHQSQRRYF
jgi:hypothetical protein